MKAIVFGCLLAACAPAREPDATVVDVVVVAATSDASSSATATRVAVAPAPTESSFSFESHDPRRVLGPFPPHLTTSSALRPQAAVPRAPASVPTLLPLLAQRVASDAPNMTPEGPPQAGSFKQGDTLELPLTLQPGRCYTLIAVSSTVTELDIALMVSPAAGLPIPATVLAMDSTSGGAAVVGPGKTCFKNPMPMAFPARMVVRATTGAGSVLAQAFAR